MESNSINTNLNIEELTPSDWPTIESMIKVIGVGGGGCNAVNYMFRENIQGCSFYVCNTDRQALDCSPVHAKIHIGSNALGAGTVPAEGRKAAIESLEEIEKTVLTPETKMLFITAGMGGGTGTGAAPVIAKAAKDRGILTVAVVTIPYEIEGITPLAKAIDGIHELKNNVDSLLVINNEKLYELFGSMLTHEAFPKADEVLATAVRGITEIISRPGYINIDFKDIMTMMKDSGMALMGCGVGKGKNRIEDAVKGALKSPLLNDFNLTTAKNLLINITAGRNKDGLTMDEMKEIDKKIEEYTGNVKKFKTGMVWVDDPEIGDEIQITAIATGFVVDDLAKIAKEDLGNIILIDKDFKYEKQSTLQQEDDTYRNDGVVDISIDERQSDNRRKFHFDEDNKPVLVVEDGKDISSLLNIPAARRQKKVQK
ncbi:MAG: cell division protein FtsZ [Candidatus Cryptobacteroides sp.]|nr:cell division protein FtsZ [Alistipes sp.]MDD7710341.1 cell division protein FtsZ [Alistipes sp.]MDY3833880.1 cell division protein FtsZ [Candidatus Cryptobacteroides sp.]